MPGIRLITLTAACGALTFGVAACGDDDSGGSSGSASGGSDAAESLQNLTGSIRVDGSSTVQPFAEAASELFGEEAPQVKITVGGAGTGDGFEKFCRGETQISNASRPIEDDEKASCAKAGVELSEVQVANDGIAVVANKDFAADCITTGALKKLLAPKSSISTYNQADPSLPNEKVSFFTPGTESGTYDFFTETVLETDAEQRTSDVQTSADDNQIITGVSGTKGGLGYVGFSYAEANLDKLKVLQVGESADSCVAPSKDSIQDGSYKPLSRPLFMYPNLKDLTGQKQVKGFMDYVLANSGEIADTAKIVPMTTEQAAKAKVDLTTAES